MTGFESKMTGRLDGLDKKVDANKADQDQVQVANDERLTNIEA